MEFSEKMVLKKSAVYSRQSFRKNNYCYRRLPTVDPPSYTIRSSCRLPTIFAPMKKFLISGSVIISIIWLGCKDSPKNTSGIINPNGDSELALLMRQMFDEGMITKQQIIDGSVPEIKVEYVKMHTAQATEPEKIARPEYVSFAKACEEAVEHLENADASQRIDAYQSLVQSCMNCHQVLCPGPMVKIKKMYLSEKEMASLK